MSTYTFSAERTIASPADRVFRILADYRNHHPRILPPSIHDLTVEEGGTGEGTVIRYSLRLLGRDQATRASVTEPEPGRVLVETILDRDFVTAFTVDPAGAECHVRIESRANTPGVQGIIERLTVPRMLKPMYERELENIDRYAREHPDV